MPSAVDIAGVRFGQLVAVEPTYVNGKRVWRCACDCGADTYVEAAKLRVGNTTSCGCRKRSVLGESTIKHGHAGSKTYVIWKSMRQRCSNPKARAYPNYGGRGIRVCARWDNYAAFLKDMGEAPPGLCIERINNDGDYAPDNCKWATRSEQMLNTRRSKRNKVKE